MKWLPAALAGLALTAPAALAGRIDITGEPVAHVRHGARLVAALSVAAYARANPDAPWPAEVGLEVLGPELAGVAASVLPGSTAEYYAGYAFEAWLVSADGSMRVPFFDPHALRLGLPDGTLLLSPGLVALSGDERGAVVLYGTAYVGEGFFGPDLTARIELWNRGPGLTVGLGPGYTMRNAITAPGVRGMGPAETSGYVTRVELVNPEPGTWLLIASGLLGFGVIKRRRSKSARR